MHQLLFFGVSLWNLVRLGEFYLHFLRKTLFAPLCLEQRLFLQNEVDKKCKNSVKSHIA
jgi:hypothetical protein